MQSLFTTIAQPLYLVFKDAGCRLIGLLAAEARRHGRKQRDGEGVVVDIDLTIEQVAQLVGASRQTVSTQLNRLIRSGLLKRESRGTYIVRDINALETYIAVAVVIRQGCRRLKRIIVSQLTELWC